MSRPRMQVGFVLGCLWALALPAGAGDLQGHVTISKKLTHKKIAPIPYNLRGAVAVPAHDHSAATGSEYRRMVVLLEGTHQGPSQPVEAVLQQEGQHFSPELLVVPRGSTVSFPNADPIFHNVFSLSKTRKFDLGYYPQGQSRSVKFDQSGIVQVYCHIHPNMYAAIVVADSPWYTQPSDDGGFSLAGIPAGTYNLLVWHNSAGLFHKKVVIPAAGPVSINIQVPIEVSE